MARHRELAAQVSTSRDIEKWLSSIEYFQKRYLKDVSSGARTDLAAFARALDEFAKGLVGLLERVAAGNHGSELFGITFGKDAASDVGHLSTGGLKESDLDNESLFSLWYVVRSLTRDEDKGSINISNTYTGGEWSRYLKQAISFPKGSTKYEANRLEAIEERAQHLPDDRRDQVMDLVDAMRWFDFIDAYDWFDMYLPQLEAAIETPSLQDGQPILEEAQSNTFSGELPGASEEALTGPVELERYVLPPDTPSLEQLHRLVR